MPEAEPSEGEGIDEFPPNDSVPELDPKQMEKLTDLVYRLVRDELLLQRERRGETTSRDWR